MYQSELTDRVDEIEKLGQLWKNSGRQSSFNKFLRWALFIQRLANPIQTRGADYAPHTTANPPESKSYLHLCNSNFKMVWEF